jgi:hypothetical protein
MLKRRNEKEEYEIKRNVRSVHGGTLSIVPSDKALRFIQNMVVVSFATLSSYRGKKKVMTRPKNS